MEPKFKVFDYVEVSGEGTGCGDLVGWIKDVQTCEILGQPYYHIRVYSTHADTVYVAEKFLKKVLSIIN